MAIETTTNKNFNGDFEVVIARTTANGDELQYPIVENSVKWETDRQGSPGKLTFKVYKDNSGNLAFNEGDKVLLIYYPNGNIGTNPEKVVLFTGYVFTKKRNKDGWIEVTAYDMLRYFKNKICKVYSKKTADQVLTEICKDYQFPMGTIDKTGFVIETRVEEDQSMLDIVQTALDLTLVHKCERYVLFDDGEGNICLRNVYNLITDVVIDATVAEDFDYTSSIDKDTYNEIQVYYEDDNQNQRVWEVAFDKKNIDRWGHLILTDKAQTMENLKDRANNLLKYHNSVSRSLKVSKAFGDYRCRAGAVVNVNLNLGDIQSPELMVIEKATHTITKNEYRMDLTLGGTQEFRENE